ncbi:MAG: hypothetical protein Q8P24_09345 [Desulfobacterales bacterium]|nr:hypothetical protein [Desulfobacterales bacterium]
MRIPRVKIFGKFMFALMLALILTGNGAIGRAAEKSPGMSVSPAVITYKEAKTLTVSGAGFSPGSIVMVGVAGIGKWKKDAPAAKDLLIGVATVQADKTFSVEVPLADSLWRVKDLAGDYEAIAKNDLGERAAAKLVIKPAKPSQKKKKK